MVKAKRRNQNRNQFQLSSSGALASLGKHPSTDFEDQRVRVLGQQNQDLYFQLKEARKEIERLKSPPKNSPQPYQVQVMEKILQERQRQDEKWGQQNHTDEKWTLILLEEVGEVAASLIDKDFENFEEEIIQVSAVAVAWAECRMKRLDKVS